MGCSKSCGWYYKQHVSSLGSFSDSFNEMIDQLSHYREKMEHISNTDVLTGTANRRAFNQMIRIKIFLVPLYLLILMV